MLAVRHADTTHARTHTRFTHVAMQCTVVQAPYFVGVLLIIFGSSSSLGGCRVGTIKEGVLLSGPRQLLVQVQVVLGSCWHLQQTL